MMHTAYIGLGSNLNEPQQQVLQAIAKLKTLAQSHLICASSLYLTPPWGIEDQPPFINAVIKIHTQLEPSVLLDELLAIEAAQGRVRDIRYGPRIIDCDILLYGEKQIATPRLSVPHPYLEKRSFVVIPLYEIAPTLILPSGLPLAEAVKQFKNEKQEKLTLLSEEFCND
jgi:2-amino-4-hydroxy-6-hydroxymethyldihydropteridine diphosphokinase